jgi:hypothetical protein
MLDHRENVCSNIKRKREVERGWKRREEKRREEKRREEKRSKEKKSSPGITNGFHVVCLELNLIRLLLPEIEM